MGSLVRLDPRKLGTSVRPRLLKMTAETEESKQKIMRNVVRLNKAVPLKDRVYINDDNTPKEHEKIRTLTEELKTRKDGGEQNLVINLIRVHSVNAKKENIVTLQMVTVVSLYRLRT